ncbi:MAG: rhomboid family intramembrane serine protease, partial [Anaerolineae bacterium]|nr:rhomboid family intramembrane serine protease [Anaerolineae bacterium]
MLPIGTVNNPTRRTPYLTYGLIALNFLVFLWELAQPQAALGQTFMQLSLVPCTVQQTALGEVILDTLRSMFFHAGWAHLLGNMLFLWIFGTNIEDYFGRRTFLSLYLLGGFAAALTHTIIEIVNSTVCYPIPVVGASGAISAVLGAYLVLYPGTRIRVLVPILRFFLHQMQIPALLMLGFWFILQLFNGVAALGVDTVGGGVAFFAHVGGFIFGLVFAFI